MEPSRKVKLQIQVTIDGFICGPNGEMDWMTWDWDEVLKSYAGELTNSVDTFLMGRATGEGMAIYWPTVAGNPESTEEDKWMAERLNSFPKVVFSRTITHIDWNNARIANDIATEVQELKKEPGKDILIYGGAGIVSSFISENLIDEYHLFINPVAIGKGKAIFDKVNNSLKLTLVKTTVSTTGIVIHQYVPQKEQAIRSSVKKDYYQTAD
jgi:dihydrofolate reductase